MKADAVVRAILDAKARIEGLIKEDKALEPEALAIADDPWIASNSPALRAALAVVVLPTISTLDEFVELDEVLYVAVLFWLLMAGPGKASLDHAIAGRLRTR